MERSQFARLSSRIKIQRTPLVNFERARTIYAENQGKTIHAKLKQHYETIAQTSFAERIGRAPGRTWMGFMHLE
jgi:hypothetical protein